MGWGYVGRGRWGVHWGGGGGGCMLQRGGVDLTSWSKLLFLGTFWKISTYWPLLDERVGSSFAESCKN